MDRQRLVAVIDPIVHAHGAELVDVELKNENGWVLRVLVERAGAAAAKMSTKAAAIDLDACSKISRELSPALDVADPIPHRYNLEVGSPGIERPLRSAADYARFAGEKAKLTLIKGVAGQKVLIGTLGDPASLENGAVVLADGDRSYEVPLEDIKAARLVFELRPAQKPGKPAAAGGKKKSKKA